MIMKKVTENWFDSIEAYDAKEKLSNEELDFGYRLFRGYQTSHDINFLKLACDNGDYVALENYAYYLLISWQKRR